MATDKNHTGGLEARIVDAARQLFIERGFVGTSMSDIAFRTKERMFDAVFGGIVGTLVPRVKDIVLQPDRPIGERVASVVDAYYDVFGANPGLPMFIVREMHRDFAGVVRTIMELRLGQYIESVRQGLQGEMDSGRLRQVPMRYLFLTFYSMLTMPFVAGNLCRTVLLDDGETFDDLLAGWKPYIVDAMERLLDAGG